MIMGRSFAVKAGLAVSSGCLALLTLVQKDWIEAVFGIHPDGRSGAFEWLVVAALFAAAIAFSLLARADLRARTS